MVKQSNIQPETISSSWVNLPRRRRQRPLTADGRLRILPIFTSGSISQTCVVDGRSGAWCWNSPSKNPIYSFDNISECVPQKKKFEYYNRATRALSISSRDRKPEFRVVNSDNIFSKSKLACKKCVTNKLPHPLGPPVASPGPSIVRTLSRRAQSGRPVRSSPRSDFGWKMGDSAPTATGTGVPGLPRWDSRRNLSDDRGLRENRKKNWNDAIGRNFAQSNSAIWLVSVQGLRPFACFLHRLIQEKKN